MKPGDLVEIIDYGGYYSTDPPKIGLIVSCAMPSWSTKLLPALVDGEILYVALHEIRPLVNPDDGGYDNTKETT